MDLALIDGGWMLPPQVPVEVHALLERLEESWLEGKFYHYEFHEGPMLFVWLGRIEGDPCEFCEGSGAPPEPWVARIPAPC